MIRAALFVAAFIAGSAMAQNAADRKPDEKDKQPAERPRLNLRLDNPSSFATTAPAEKEQQRGLPSLGDDARRIQRPPAEPGTRPEGGPYPRDTNPNI